MLTPDTSVVHICSAFDLPCIALFTFNNDPNTGMPWSPLSKSSKILKVSEEETLKSIKVSDVLETLNQIIEEIND
jgi:ADP-heptose:LPS heptosyltransferase